jgi:hypothetical protein
MLDYVNLIENLPDRDILDESIEGLSDHTIDFSLYRKYNPQIYECHVGFEKKDALGPSEFIKTFDEVEAIL